MRVCIVGASGKLGKHMVGLALDRGHEVVAVCREQSVTKLADFDRAFNTAVKAPTITIIAREPTNINTRT